MHLLTKLAITAAGYSVLLAISPPVNAAVTASFCGPVGGNSCELPGEQKVFLQAKTDTQVGFGNVGSQNGLPVVRFSTEGGLLDVFIDLKNGFSTIKPSNGISFNGLDITIPGFTFTDLLWRDQLAPSETSFDLFKATGFSGAHVSDGFFDFSEKADTDKEYSIHAIGGAFDEVDLKSLTGFDEIKQIEVFGLAPIPTVATPEISTWAMLVAGFGLMGFGAWYRGRFAAGTLPTSSLSA